MGQARTPVWVPVFAGAAVVVVDAVGAGVLLAVRDRLPERIATHWGSDGHPDGFQSFTALLTFQSVFVLVMGGFLLLVGFAVKQLREMAVVAVGLAVFLTAVITSGTVRQAGLADGAQAGGVGPDLLVGLVAALVVGVLTWLVTRHHGPQPVACGPLPLGAPVLADPAAPLEWTGRLRRAPLAIRLLLWVATIGLGVGAVVVGFVDGWATGLFLALLALVAIPLNGCLSARVQIDQHGVRAHRWGVRWLTIPLSAVESAEVETSVDPMGDFGGWGIRSGFRGARGMVSSSGEGLRIHRAERSDWVLTVDDAQRAAAVLNTLVARR